MGLGSKRETKKERVESDQPLGNLHLRLESLWGKDRERGEESRFRRGL